jgi:16S rRNA C967 or C1407 C5-methylase (RsmB/RsmF family)
MAALMAGRGAIVANELDPVRAERLAFNVRLQGCPIVEVRRGRGERLGAELPGAFDRVLLDVPCSGEGRFLVHEPATFRAWSPRRVARCARLQRRLLASGAQAARPGGVLVYSTCTLNEEENESTVRWALEQLPLELEAVPLSLPGALPGLQGLEQALRILPDRDHEGFFVCRMRRRM